MVYALLRAIAALEGLEGDNDDETTGILIIKRAIEEPMRQIVANAGVEGAVIVQKVKEGKGDFGYNARLDVFQNLYESGVIDPAKVTRIALENAASIAGMFLTTECVLGRRKRRKICYASARNGWWNGWNDVIHIPIYRPIRPDTKPPDFRWLLLFIRIKWKG